MKITRNAYKRKVILFGLMVFMSIALISTGFAAWILSKEATQEGGGNVTVGSVDTTGVIGLTIDNADNLGNFVFEPKESDTTGNVKNDGENFENLSITITGIIENADVLNSLTVSLTVSEVVKNAAAAGYIVLPECESKAVELVGTSQLTVNKNKGTFNYIITFKWGSKFNGMNPGEYYDIDETGKNVEYEEMKKTLDAFYAAMGSGADCKYSVTITATPK